MKEQLKLVSVPTLCKLYSKDTSQMRKMIDKLGIQKHTVRRADDKRVVTAISDEDHQLLVDTYPNLTAKKATKQDISLADACKLLGYADNQISNFTRLCKSKKIDIFEKKFNGRTQKCISKKDFKKVEKSRAIPVVDVE